MPDSADVHALQRAIHEQHGVTSRHLGAIDVNSVFGPGLPFHGIVSAFELHDHPDAVKAYAWFAGGPAAVIVLAVSPVVTAVDAVRAWLAAS